VKQTNLRKEIEQILDRNIDYGYKYLMSDYATNYIKEKEYEKEGRKEVKQTIEQLLQLFSTVCDDVIGEDEKWDHAMNFRNELREEQRQRKKKCWDVWGNEVESDVELI
jgi:hypothetical protein